MLSILFLLPSCGRGKSAADPVAAVSGNPGSGNAVPPEAVGSGSGQVGDYPPSSTSAVEGETPYASAPIELPRLIMRTLSAKDEAKTVIPSGTDLLIPGGMERARLPNDFAIGVLGMEQADPAAYRFALSFVSDLASAKDVSERFFERGKTESAAAAALLKPLSPVTVRVGGGIPAEGGTVSFLVRFIGKESSVTGELQVSSRDGSWSVSVLLLDDPVKDENADGSARFDPFSYKRFL